MDACCGMMPVVLGTLSLPTQQGAKSKCTDGLRSKTWDYQGKYFEAAKSAFAAVGLRRPHDDEKSQRASGRPDILGRLASASGLPSAKYSVL